MNGKKLIIAFAVFVCICQLFDSCFLQSTETDSDEINRIRDRIREEQCIIHAGGYISNDDGVFYTYTNSKDALLNCYAKGNKISEIDFRISSDNCLVCTHEWNMMYKDGISIGNEPVTKDEFLECCTWGGFTSMWLGDLVDFLEEHSDFLFVTDIKDDNFTACRIIADFCPEWKDNFIIQIYHPHEYNIIRRLGFKNIIFTLYAASEKERDLNNLLKFANNNELVGFTYWHYWTDIYLEPFLQAGYDSYIHTVNDPAQRTTFLNSGVAAIYTDTVDN